MAARLIKFMGSHPDLVTGHMYTAREYASVSGVPHNAMATRLHKALEVHDSHLRPMYGDSRFGSRPRSNTTPRQKSSFSTPTEKLSGEWLNRRLV
mgnify:CR=1 FL=1